MNEPLINYIIDRIISLILLSLNTSNLLGNIFIFFGILFFTIIMAKNILFLPLLFTISSIVLLIFSGKYFYFNINSFINGAVSKNEIFVSLSLTILTSINIILLFLAGLINVSVKKKKNYLD